VNTIEKNIGRCSKNFDAILLDAYGVFWGGNGVGLLPGAKEVMADLTTQGKIVGILSNSTQLGEKEIQKLHTNGLIQGEHFHFMVTSGDIIKEVLFREELPFETPNKTYCLSGNAHPKFSSHKDIFFGSPYAEVSHFSQADFIYTSIPHILGEDQTNPDVFKEHVKNVIASGLPLVCANPDRFAHEGNPARAVVRQGTIARMYEELGGKVIYFGKPYSIAFKVAMERFASWGIWNPNQVLMVGDTPETDIRGANLFGMNSVLVTKTGITADRISHAGMEIVLNSLSKEEVPHYLIETLG